MHTLQYLQVYLYQSIFIADFLCMYAVIVIRSEVVFLIIIVSGTIYSL